MKRLILALLLTAIPALADDQKIVETMVCTLDQGRCSCCIAEGKRSRVAVGSCSSTLMASNWYYDEDGNYHGSDPNTTRCTFYCSNGHQGSY